MRTWIVNREACEREDVCFTYCGNLSGKTCFHEGNGNGNRRLSHTVMMGNNASENHGGTGWACICGKRIYDGFPSHSRPPRKFPSHCYPCKALDYLWVFRMFVRGRFWKGMICVNFSFPAKGFLTGGEMKRKGDYFLLYSWESQFLLRAGGGCKIFIEFWGGFYGADFTFFRLGGFLVFFSFLVYGGRVM